MLTRLLEDILGTEGIAPVLETTVLPTDTIIVQIANNDTTKFHRLQIIEVDESEIAPKLFESDYQNPAAFSDIAPSTDGTMSCLSPSPAFNITCAGGTSSAYFVVDPSDLFDIEINGVSHVGVSIEQIQTLLGEKSVDFVPMKNDSVTNP